MKMHSTEQLEKQKKFFLALPILILPFLTLGFWALRGGQDKASDQLASGKGINTELPEAQFKDDKPQDKFSLYDQAARDSARAQHRSDDPVSGSLAVDTLRPATDKIPSASADEVQISRKLTQIRQQLDQPEPVAKPVARPVLASASSPETEKLEKMIRSVQDNRTEDPELQQLSEMLDKIQAIQNPDLAREKFKQELPPSMPDTLFKAVPAAIDGDQKVVQGGIVRLRLQDTMRLNGLLLDKGQALFGNCTLVNQRLLLNIKNIRIGNAIIPVDLTVFSLDGLAGIDAPEAELAEAAGTGSSNALQSMTFMPMDQTLATQAAGAGIETAKSLFSKKIKRIKVKLQTGYPVLLRNNQPGK
ncbi:hypothetical protein GCM10027037_00640 [Mucilaginibacter koreensis]